MASIRKIKVVAFACSVCRSLREHRTDACVAAAHRVSRTTVSKRFFSCARCGERTDTLAAKYPSEGCRKCGKTAWKRAGLYRERGPAGPDRAGGSNEGAGVGDRVRPRGAEHAFAIGSRGYYVR